jgi:hypothetical protein
MAQVVGEVGDGLAAHTFITEDYMREVLLPALQSGAARADKSRPPVLLQMLVAPSREAASAQMLAYVVPGYRRVLDHAGLGEIADRVMEAMREGRRAEARQLIDQHLLDRLAIVIGADPESLGAALERWRPHAERLSLSVPWFGTDQAEQAAHFERVLQGLAKLH